MIRGTTYQRKDWCRECRVSPGVGDGGRKKYRSFYGKTKEEAEYKMVISCQNASQTGEEITEMTVREPAMEWLSISENRRELPNEDRKTHHSNVWRR